MYSHSLSLHVNDLIRVCFTGIWIKSFEPDEAISELATMCRSENWRFATWDIEQGLAVAGTNTAIEAPDPIAAVRSIGSIAEPDQTNILVLKNFHRFLGSPEVIQATNRVIQEGKSSRTFLIVLAPSVQLPPELERLFVVIDHELPTRDELDSLLLSIATEVGDLPSDTELELVLDASVGLTRYEAENAYSLSLVKHRQVRSETVWELKTQALKKSGLLSLCRSKADFSSLGGLAAIKAFTKRALLRSGRTTVHARPRGVLLLSPPGCGKSEFCKALGSEVGRPVLMLDVGALMGSLVGQSEERTREALRIIDAMAPCIVMIDEIEKAFSGANGSGDGGVSSRMFGTLLTWLNDHTSDAFVVCTANDVARLPPEFSRAERFDGVFFVDLPSREQKDAIWQIYRDMFNIATDEPRPSDEQWTGAEIKSCCRLAALLDVPLSQASQNVVPVAFTSAESVQRLKQWASGRCLDAGAGGIYVDPSLPSAHTKSTPPRRRVSRSGSANN